MKESKRKNNIKIEKKDEEILKKRFKDIAHKMCFASGYLYMSTTDELLDMDKNYLIRYIEELESLYEFEEVNLNNIVEKLFDKKEIMELMYICYKENKKDFYNDNRLILWLVSAGQITYLLRSYKKIKELVNEKYGEDLLTERETLREELKLTKNKLEVAEYYKNKYAKEIDEVCDQNLKLRHEISKYNNDYEDDFKYRLTVTEK